ncbi:uncharacterized protein LOC118205583 [Stegodyphus dumicola]|uniref:uncharacterized protein LOC118205583 n=1 Tax=Stegodyphus dumicola TaxID=202533 RepID=UPI0015A7AF47|nr:uncharacterized protein LOC118205583 [Stegodyphus dumicola]
MNMCPSNKRKLAPELCLKGQVYFIWSTYQNLQELQNKISLLGGKVDEFFSRDITTVLVEDIHLLGYQFTPCELSSKPSYNPSGVVAPAGFSPGGFFNLPSTSRGYSLLPNNYNSPYRVICNARQWGIQILGITQFLSWIDPHVKSIAHQKKKKTESFANLSGCYVKFESCQKKYRPCYKMFNNNPEYLMPLKNANILVKPDTCNVILDQPSGQRQLYFNHMDSKDYVRDSNVLLNAGEKKAVNASKLKPKEENNYCECCRTHFTDLKLHIRSVKHQTFVSNEKNYESVHSILKMLPSAQEFIEKHKKTAHEADLVFQNSDLLQEYKEDMTVVDFSMPLNLQVKKHDSPPPLNLNNNKMEASTASFNATVKNEELIFPLDLQMKKLKEIKEESYPVKREATDDQNMIACKTENILQPKVELANNADIIDKLDNKESNCNPEISEELPTKGATIDSMFDKSNCADLAQLCLKNFDSYWLDNLPCEMDDIMFDDNIFDFDDGKQKLEEEPNKCLQPLENCTSTDIAQSPSVNFGISASCFKMQCSTTNASTFFNSSMNVKDTKNGSDKECENYLSSCRVEEDAKETFLPMNVTMGLNQSLVDTKNFKLSNSFEIKQNPFYEKKANTDLRPSFSCVMSEKMSEQMFSSDSSNDEDGNVLISNALNMIADSDSDNDSISNCVNAFKKHQKESLASADICSDVPAVKTVESAAVSVSLSSICSSHIATIPISVNSTCSAPVAAISVSVNSTCSASTSAIPISVNSTCDTPSAAIPVSVNSICSSPTAIINSVNSTSSAPTITIPVSVNSSCSSFTAAIPHSVSSTCTVPTVAVPVSVSSACSVPTVAIPFPVNSICSSLPAVIPDSGSSTCSAPIDAVSLPVNSACSSPTITATSEPSVGPLPVTESSLVSSSSIPAAVPVSAESWKQPLERNTSRVKKIPPKKSVSKLRKLPPVWSVNIVPGNGVRLKFTCIRPETIESVDESTESAESEFSD